MGVFANGLEISGKAVDAKTIAVMPDTCFTPPEAPPTPTGVPIPYPSFGMASDTDKGTGTVKIGGKTVNIKNKSYLTKTSGTEAGCAAKKGIITSKNTGKKYFNSWSNNVKFDAEPVVRFTDLATHNHASPSGNSVPSVEICGMNLTMPTNFKCIVGSYSRGREECSKQGGQFHHIIPDRTYRSGRVKGKGLTPSGKQRRKDKRMDTTRFPSHSKGVCICLPKVNHCKTKSTPSGTNVVHELLDDDLTELGSATVSQDSPRGLATMSDVRDQCLSSLEELTPNPISEECFDLAFDEVHKQTADIADKQVRAEKSLNNVSSRARGVMNKQ